MNINYLSMKDHNHQIINVHDAFHCLLSDNHLKVILEKIEFGK